METKVCKHCGEEKPLVEFHANRWGATRVCNVCYSEKSREAHIKRKAKKGESDILRDRIAQLEKELDGARKIRLDDFTPREMFTKLKELGFKWEQMTYTRIETVDWNKI